MQGWNWITQAWELFAKEPGIWMLNVFLLFFISIVCMIIVLLGWIAICLMTPVFVGGLMLGCRALQRGEKLEVGHLFAGFKQGTSQLVTLGIIVLISLIMFIMIMIVVSIIGGAGAALAGLAGGLSTIVAAVTSFLLVFLVGLLVSLLVLIPISMALWFAPCLIVFRGVAAVDAMKLSFDACLKNILPFLLYSLIALVVFVLVTIAPHVIPLVGSLVSFLVSLVFWAVIYASVYTGYRDIFGDT
jgi:hypothetical protein